jgi:ectoine hydroxylase-related dioxygenase (phytanoyl-CoA dioxygenase family)
MITSKEKSFFLEHGYLVVENILEGAYLKQVQAAFDEAWEAENAPPCNQHRLLKYPAFRELIEHGPILDRHRAIFGQQVQLLQYELLRQGPRSEVPERTWHRDFAFPAEQPLAINTILFIDDITPAQGPTRVVPGSHKLADGPPAAKIHEPLQDEIAVTCPAGSAIFINAPIWHSGSRNVSDGLRRGIYLYYGYWWLKRYDADQELPWQALEDASEERLRLLGLKMPDRDLHMYNPAL